MTPLELTADELKAGDLFYGIAAGANAGRGSALVIEAVGRTNLGLVRVDFGRGCVRSYAPGRRVVIERPAGA